MGYAKANKLAKDNNISRKVLSIRFDDKRNQWCITHETSCGVKDAPDFRCDVDYFIFDLTPEFKINEVLKTIKAEATMSFLGMDEKPAKTRATKAEKVDKAPEPEPEVTSGVYVAPEVKEVAEEPKPEPKKRGRKKKVETVVQTESVEIEEDPLAIPDDEPVTEEVYQKNQTAHAVHLRDLIEDKFGSEWKTNKQAVTTVKGLVAKLHNTIPVVNGEGKVLQSFVEFVDKHLKTA